MHSEPLGLERDHDLARMYVLSPYVWPGANAFEILVRGVPKERNPVKKVSAIFHGTGDGRHFRMNATPVIAPSVPQDAGGCEDPTVCVDDEALYVFYSGWSNEAGRSTLLLAAGRTVEELEKRGAVLPADGAHENPKEATLVRRPDGRWVLFFEFSRDGHSLIGTALGDRLSGPWQYAREPLPLRAHRFDSWHLSTGPVVTIGGAPTMFYNGADQRGYWCIGWAAFDEDYARVVDRCEEPLISAPQPPGDFRHTVFASSGVTAKRGIDLYYTAFDAEPFHAMIESLR
ncbi:MAG: hypothetical protein JO036_19935 [Candidatus Eremiobacteraeota bacterium]|nr:hypothetical protein [Candidatus Eremiobacteraeota bacterium]